MAVDVLELVANLRERLWAEHGDVLKSPKSQEEIQMTYYAGGLMRAFILVVVIMGVIHALLIGLLALWNEIDQKDATKRAVSLVMSMAMAVWGLYLLYGQ